MAVDINLLCYRLLNTQHIPPLPPQTQLIVLLRLLMKIYCVCAYVRAYVCVCVCVYMWVGWSFSMTGLTSDSRCNILCIILTFTDILTLNLLLCHPLLILSTSSAFVSCAVQQKQQLEKETGLKIVEAGVSDVSYAL